MVVDWGIRFPTPAKFPQISKCRSMVFLSPFLLRLPVPEIGGEARRRQQALDPARRPARSVISLHVCDETLHRLVWG